MRTNENKVFRFVLAGLLALLLQSSGALAADDAGNSAGDLGSAFTEGVFSGHLKTLWFIRNFDGDRTDWSTLAIGGNLKFETAPLYGFRAGVGVKASVGDVLDDKHLYGGLLQSTDDPSEGDSYGAFDEYYLSYTNWDTTLTLGAYAIESPWVQGFDIRMNPKKYRGAKLKNNSYEPLTVHLHYIADWLDWTADSWESIASGLTKNTDDDEGAFVAGLAWQLNDSWKIQAWDYYFDEVFNGIYGRVDYTQKFGDGYSFGARLKYLDQRDVGNAKAGELDTYVAGGDVSLAAYGGKLSLYYGQVGDDTLLNPFGGDYVVLMQTKWIERAEEQVWGVRFDYDFGQLGVQGLTTYLFYADFDTPDAGVNASTDHAELDFSLKYQLTQWVEGLSVWFRWAHVDQDENVANGNDWDDIRFYINYKF